VNGAEFIRRMRKVGRRTGVPVRFDPRPGKGSHGRLYCGERYTTLMDRKKEISRPLLHRMCRQLGITPAALH
jgi:mRNA interferase HicA